MSASHDLLERRDRAKHIRHMGDGSKSGPGTDARGQCLGIQAPVILHINPFEDGSMALPEEVPWNNVGMMLHYRKHDLVARLNTGREEGVGNQIYRLRPALGENYFVFTCGIEEFLHRAARSFIGISGGSRKEMYAAVDIRIVAFGKARHR